MHMLTAQVLLGAHMQGCIDLKKHRRMHNYISSTERAQRANGAGCSGSGTGSKRGRDTAAADDVRHGIVVVVVIVIVFLI